MTSLSLEQCYLMMNSVSGSSISACMVAIWSSRLGQQMNTLKVLERSAEVTQATTVFTAQGLQEVSMGMDLLYNSLPAVCADATLIGAVLDLPLSLLSRLKGTGLPLSLCWDSVKTRSCLRQLLLRLLESHFHDTPMSIHFGLIERQSFHPLSHSPCRLTHHPETGLSQYQTSSTLCIT